MTFCVIIERQLVTKTCPVPEGNCVWRDRKTNYCKYKEELVGCDPRTLAAVVNVPAPTEAEQESIKADIKAAVIKEIS